MSDFKLNYYFELYKDLPLPNRDMFRKKFKKKYGRFQHLEELIRMIEKYQIESFGETLSNFIKERGREEARKLHNKANARDKRRLGKCE